MNEKACPFTSGECDGGTIRDDGMVGCAFKQTPDSECSWLADLPDGASPREYRNAMLVAAAAEVDGEERGDIE